MRHTRVETAVGGFARQIVASFVGVGLLLLLVVGVVYLLTPRTIQVNVNASSVPDGQRMVVLNAVETNNLKNVMHSEVVPATVTHGYMTIDWRVPDNLRDKSFVVEVCSSQSDSTLDPDCVKKIASDNVKGARTDGPLYSCPYFVADSKSRPLAVLTHRNDITLDNRIYCQTVDPTDEFSQASRVEEIATIQAQGIRVQGNGVLVAENGTITTKDLNALIAESDAQKTTIVQQVVPGGGTDSQTLSLSGLSLSISGGNTIILPQQPYASASSDGILTSTDWNAFAAKENSLMFDSSFVRAGDSISLMSCAAGEILKSGGSNWVCANDIGSGSASYFAGTGISIDLANTINNTGVLSVVASGALSSSGGQNPAISLSTNASLSQLAGQLSLATVGTAGTYNNVTTDAYGRVTSATNVAYLTTEADGVIGNEVSGVVTGGGLLMTGSGTVGSPYRLGLITTCATGELLKWNGTAWACAGDVDTNTDTQTLSFNPTTSVLTITGGNTVDLTALKDNTDSQAISRSGNTISITGNASTVDLTPYLDNTDAQTLSVAGSGTGRTLTISGGNTVGIGDSDAQTLSIAGNVISLTNGGSVTLPVDQNTTYTSGSGLSLVGTVFSINAPTCSGTTKLQWNGSAFVCATDVDTDTDAQTLSWNNGTRTLTISGSASSVVIPDADTTYVAGNGLALTSNSFAVNAPTCAGTTKLVWNGTSFSCATDVDTDTTDFNVRANAGASENISAGETLTFLDGTGTTVSMSGNNVTYSLSSTGTAGTYGSSTSVPVITTDAQGRVVSVTTQSITFPPETDAIIGNEVVGGTGSNSGLTRAGSGTTVDPYTLAVNVGNGLQVSGNQVAIIAPTCSGTTKLQWNGTAFVCSTDIDTNTDAQTLTANTGAPDGSNTTTTSLSISGGNSVQFIDRDTLFTAGAGLSLTGTSFSLAQQGATTGQVLQWSGSAWVPTTIAGTDSQTLSYNATTRDLSISGANTITFPLASGTTTGMLSTSDWSAFSSKENVLTFSDGLARAGDAVTLMDCAANQILQRNGADTAWLCANQVVDTNTTYSAGTGISLTGTTFANTGVLSVSASGALTSSGGQNPGISLTTTADLTQLASQLGLSTTGVTPGTYNNVTVDDKGRVTSASNVSYLTGYTETDGAVGNEVAGVVTNGGLVMTGAGTAGDPYKLGLITTCSDGQLLKYTTAGGWACASDIDTDTNTDAQTLTWNSGANSLAIAGGNSVDLSSLKDNTDSQTLSWNGGTRTLSLTNGGSVVITDADTTYSAGNGLSLSSTVFAINAPTCSGTDKLQWNGTAFVCSADVDTDTTYSAGTGISLTGTTFSLTNDFGASIDSSEITNGTVATADLAAPTASNNTTYGDSGVNVANITVNDKGQVVSIANRTLPTADTSTTGVLSSTDWNTFNGKENVLTFADGLTRTGNAVTLMDCAASQIIQRNGGDTAWVCASQVVDTNTTYSAGIGLSLTGTTFANTGTLSVTASGALTSSGGQNPAISLVTTGNFTQSGNTLDLSDTTVTPGTYNNVTVDAKGRVTGGTNVSYLTSYTEADGVIGNEVADVATNGGLVMTGAGTTGDPYKVGLITTCSDGQLLKYYGTDPDGAGPLVAGWNCSSDIDTDTDTDAQTLSWNTLTNMLSIAGGNTVDLSSLKDNTDAQAISRTGNTISITGNASTVDLTPYLDNTDGQTLNLATNTLSISGGNSVNLAPYLDNTDSQALSWNGGTRTLNLTGGGSVVISDSDTTYSAGVGITLTGTTFSLTNDFGASIDSTEITDGTIAAADLASSGATAGTYGDTGVSVAQLTVNAQGQVTAVSSRALPTANTATTGVLSSSDWNTFNGKENVLTFSDGLARSVDTVTLMDCAAGQILQRNGGDTAWVCANQVVDIDTTYSAGTGLSLVGTTFNNTGVLSVGASGALSSSGGQNPAITLTTTSDLTQLANQLGLSDTGVSAGTYNNVTVDAKGRVTAATNVAYLTTETDSVVGNEIANVAANSGLVMTGSGTSGDPYKVGLVTSCSDNQLLKYTSGGGWACANDIDTDTNTDAQTLNWNTGTNILTISGGNTVNLSSLQDNTDSQAISRAGNTISITGNASTVDLTPYLDNTDSQALSLATDTLSLTGGGSVDLSGYLDNTDSQALSWNGGTRTLSLANGGSVVISDADTTYSAGTGITLTGTTFSLTNDFGASIDSSEITNGTVATADLAAPTASNNTTYGDSGVNVANITVNDKGQVVSVSNRALPTANTGTSGILSSADWNTFNGKENVLTFTGNGLFNRSGNTITGIAGTVSGQVLKWNGSAWATGTDNDTTYTNGNGLSLSTGTFSINAPTCSGTTKLQWNGTTFVCSADVDTDTTNFNILANGAGSQNVASGNNVNFQNGTGTTASVDASKNVSFGLTNVGTAGTYGSATSVPVITTDAQGRVTGVTNTPINFPAEVDGVVGNEVTNATANGGLVRGGSGTGGSPYTLGLLTTCSDQQVLKYTLGTTTWGCANDTDTNTTYTNGTGLSLVGTTFSITNTAVSANSYTPANNANGSLALPQFTVNAQGQLTAASTTNITLTGIANSQLANNSLTVGAGNGLLNGGSVALGGTTTLNIGAGSGITVNADDITIDLTAATDALSATTSSGSGLEVLASGLTLLQGCSDGQVLQWSEAADVWACTTPGGATYTGGSGISIAGTVISSTLGIDIDSAEIINGTIAAADIGSDVLNFSELSDSLVLDASTTLSLGANNFTTNLNGTGDYAVQFAGNTVISVLDTGAVSIGSILSDQTIGIDNGTGAINIATDSDANTTNIGTGSGADTVNVGDSNANVSITDANWSITGAGAANFTSFSGSGLTDCDQSDQVLKWDSASGQFICGTNRATFHNVMDGDYTNATTTFSDVDNNSDATDKIGFAAGANETWVFEASMSLLSNATADSKWQVTAPTGSTCDIAVSNIEQAISVSNLACATSTGLIAVAASDANEVKVSGSIKTGGTAGNVVVQFGQNTASGTSTIHAGSYITAYRVSGADYAETYFTSDNRLKPGMIAKLSGGGPSQVVAADTAYSDRQIGIVSTAPGSVIGAADGSGRPIPMALTGRVPIMLSTENGVPKAGDMITASGAKPGYGMKAVRSGYVVGQLMLDATDNGDGTASGYVYVRHGFWQAPVSFDLSSIVGVSVISNSENSTEANDQQVGLTEFASFDQTTVDEIMRGFTVQQDQINELKSRIATLETASTATTTSISSADLGSLLNKEGSGLAIIGTVHFKDNVVFGTNAAGTVAVQPGQQTVAVTFSRPHPGSPIVTLSPTTFVGAEWRVSQVSADGFTVELSAPATSAVQFSWHALYGSD